VLLSPLSDSGQGILCPGKSMSSWHGGEDLEPGVKIPNHCKGTTNTPAQRVSSLADSIHASKYHVPNAGYQITPRLWLKMTISSYSSQCLQVKNWGVAIAVPALSLSWDSQDFGQGCGHLKAWLRLEDPPPRWLVPSRCVLPVWPCPHATWLNVLTSWWLGFLQKHFLFLWPSLRKHTAPFCHTTWTETSLNPTYTRGERI
jgi:hypothetical protein